jgi:predicted nucleic acid-binding protein
MQEAEPRCIDTNISVYATQTDSARATAAHALLGRAASTAVMQTKLGIHAFRSFRQRRGWPACARHDE